MNLLIESMTRLQVAGYRVRVWRQEDPGEAGEDWHYGRVDNSDLKLAAAAIRGVGMTDVAKKLIAIDRVNAVEVVNGLGEGIVLYKDWP